MIRSARDAVKLTLFSMLLAAALPSQEGRPSIVPSLRVESREEWVPLFVRVELGATSEKRVGTLGLEFEHRDGDGRWASVWQQPAKDSLGSRPPVAVRDFEVGPGAPCVWHQRIVLASVIGRPGLWRCRPTVSWIPPLASGVGRGDWIEFSIEPFPAHAALAEAAPRRGNEALANAWRVFCDDDLGGRDGLAVPGLAWAGGKTSLIPHTEDDLKPLLDAQVSDALRSQLELFAAYRLRQLAMEQKDERREAMLASSRAALARVNPKAGTLLAAHALVEGLEIQARDAKSTPESMAASETAVGENPEASAILRDRPGLQRMLKERRRAPSTRPVPQRPGR